MRYSLIYVLVAALIGLCGTARAADSGSAVLESGYQLPEGFTSIDTSRTASGNVRVDAIYEHTDGTKLRFTTARGSMADVEPGSNPIDVCVRDEKTGKPLVAGQFGDDTLIKGCGQTRGDVADVSHQIQAAVKSLRKVKFKSEYRGEYAKLVGLGGMLKAQRAMIHDLTRDDVPSTPIYDEKTGKQIGVVKHLGE